MTKRNKSNGRKGFSLVEVIVVVAVLAVLVAVLTPALLAYVERSRAQKDFSAMDEVTNAVRLALADEAVYDELLDHNVKGNVSCYIDQDDETKVSAYKTPADATEKYTFTDEARQADETPYFAAGDMRGVTITFKSTAGARDAKYILADGAINQFVGGNGSKLEDCTELYSRIHDSVGTEVELNSQAYRNSEYTIFIKMGTLGGLDATAEDAVQVYGQFDSTNLTATREHFVRIAGGKTTGNGEVTQPSVSVNLSAMTPADILDPNTTEKIVIQDGAMTYNTDKQEQLVVRADIEFNTFKDVLVNGNVVDKSNYVATEGSTVVTFTEEYSQELAKGNNTIQIISDTEYATATVDVTGTVPGATFKNLKSDGCHASQSQHTDDCFDGTIFLTWDELKLAENGTKYGYRASKISDTSLGMETFASNRLLTSIVIPKSITTLPTDAFSYCTSLESITIPDGVTTIKNYALENCTSLTNVMIPSSVTSIGKWAFQNSTSLENITFGGTVAQWNNIALGDDWDKNVPATVVHCSDGDVSLGKPGATFSDGTFLTWDQLQLSENGTKYGYSAWKIDGEIGAFAFEDCTSLTSIMIPDGVTSISDQSFDGCASLTSVTIPVSVTSVGVSSFANCISLENIAFEGTMEQWNNIALGNRWFRSVPATVVHCSDGDVQIRDNDGPGATFTDGTFLAWDRLTIADNGTKYGYKASAISDLIINKEAFSGCDDLVSIKLPDSMTTIYDDAFSGCTSLVNIEMPDSVTGIWPNAFSGCTSLTNITLPANLTRIDTNAFSGCTSLESITMPENLTTIANCAFQNCTALTSVTFPVSVNYIGQYAFQYCTSLANIVFNGTMAQWDEVYCVLMPNGTLTDWNNFVPATAIHCSDGDVPVPGATFADGTFLTWGELPLEENGTKYGYDASLAGSPFGIAFRGCTSLTSITIPEGITQIGNMAFQNCTSLANITIPNGVTSIGVSAFQNCTSLTSITIPDGVTQIQNQTFYGCAFISNITIPSSVTSISGSAFHGCTSLKNITIPDSVTSIGSSAFKNCTSLTSITISDSVATIGRNTFSGCTSLANVALPESLITIEGYAFQNCTSLASVTIPEGIKYIDSYAFAGCTALTNITFNGTVEQWNNIALGNEWANSVPTTVVHCSDGDAQMEQMPTVATFSDGTSLTWYDLKLSTNGTNYGYKASSITDTTIGRIAFYRCKSITSIEIQDGVTSIEYAAFDGSSLTSITIPASVKDIGGNAFANCTSLDNITFEGTIEQWNKIFCGADWNMCLAADVIHCSDGDVESIWVDTSTDTDIEWSD